MEFTTIQLLKMFIEDEERDAFLYKELSNNATNLTIREILFGMSMDEQTHADSFKKTYNSITGKNYNPVIIPKKLGSSFYDTIAEQILGEVEGYEKYASQYYKNDRNKQLRQIYFNAMTDENSHAHKLSYILFKLSSENQ